MCYRRAYSFGNNPDEAFVLFKYNELSYGNKITKSEIFEIKKPKHLSSKRFELYLNFCINYDLDREKTKPEKRAYDYLTSVYGYSDFKKIMLQYRMKNSNTAIIYIDNKSKQKMKHIYDDLDLNLHCYIILY